MGLAKEWKPQGQYGQRAVAITLEGTLKSAFAGNEASGISAPAQSKDKSRVLVISAAQFLANPFARAGNPPPMPPQMAMMGSMGGDEQMMMISQPYAQQYLTETILALKNSLDWMGGDSDLHRGQRQATRRHEPYLCRHSKAKGRSGRPRGREAAGRGIRRRADACAAKGSVDHDVLPGGTVCIARDSSLAMA